MATHGRQDTFECGGTRGIVKVGVRTDFLAVEGGALDEFDVLQMLDSKVILKCCHVYTDALKVSRQSCR